MSPARQLRLPVRMPRRDTAAMFPRTPLTTLHMAMPCAAACLLLQVQVAVIHEGIG